MNVRPRSLLALTLLLVAGGQVTCFVSLPAIYQPDSASYIETGKRLFAGLGFTNAAGGPPLFRTPLYPVLVGLFDSLGLGMRGLVLFQHFLNVVLSGLIFAFCQSHFRSTV